MEDQAYSSAILSAVEKLIPEFTDKSKEAIEDMIISALEKDFGIYGFYSTGDDLVSTFVEFKDGFIDILRFNHTGNQVEVMVPFNLTIKPEQA